MQNRRNILFRRTLIGLGCIVAGSCVLLIALTELRDWQRRRPFLLGERARQLGVGETPNAANFAPEQVVHRMSPITELQYLDATEVSDEVLPNELVLGVVVQGVARAYPINIMNGPSREIFNDRLGEKPIAATW